MTAQQFEDNIVPFLKTRSAAQLQQRVEYMTKALIDGCSVKGCNDDCLYTWEIQAELIYTIKYIADRFSTPNRIVS